MVSMKIGHVMLLVGAFHSCPVLAQIESSDDSAKQERIRILKERGFLDEYGSSRLHLIENVELPADVIYPKGALSLVADPKARGGGKIAIYIINGTEKPASGLVCELTQVWQEVRDGETWKRTRPVRLGCGNVAPPMDLMAGHTLIRTAEDPALGDVDGNLRYCFWVLGDRPIASQVIRGKFSSKDFETAGFGQNRLEESILNDLDMGVSRGVWNQCRISQNHEEFAAAVELLRFYDEGSTLRNALNRRFENPKPSSKPKVREPEGFRNRLRKTLASPWRKSISEREFFTHCLKLLSNPAETKTQNFDGKFRALIWGCLNQCKVVDFVESVNPERYDQLESYRALGNPWGAENTEMDLIVTLAEADLVSKDPKLQEAAGRFLMGEWVTVGLFSDARLRGLLESSSPIAKRTALLMLNHRNQRDEAISWLGEHYDKLGGGLIWVWNELRQRDEPFAAWETPIAKYLIEHQPLDAFFWLNSHINYGGKSAKSKLPAELRDSLRKYLQKEAKDWKVRGGQLPQYNSEGMLVRNDRESRDPQCLAAGLSILAGWEMPEDTELIQAFLTHPGAGYSRHDKVTETKFYTVREEAVRLLKIRKVATPSDVILKENIRARDLPPS